MSKKYIKNENGIVRAVTSDNLQLEKPLANENYDIEVHNRNMDKIDSAIQEVKGKIDGLELVASNVKMADGTTVEDAVLANKANISSSTALANQALAKADEALQAGSNVKQSLVDKLTSEGLNVSTDNTFEELIGNIALGKKWASGTGVKSSSNTWFNYSGSTSTRSMPYVDINLGFIPSIIIVSCYLSPQTSESFSILNNMGKVYAESNVKVSRYNEDYNSSYSSYNFICNDKINLGNNVYRIPIYPDITVNDLTWIAFE